MLRRTFLKSGSDHSQIRQIKKIALDSKTFNEAIHNNKYEMQSIDHIVDKNAI